jgi:hypothetical protein
MQKQCDMLLYYNFMDPNFRGMLIKYAFMGSNFRGFLITPIKT